jgi:hypothetical protein
VREAYGGGVFVHDYFFVGVGGWVGGVVIFVLIFY